MSRRGDWADDVAHEIWKQSDDDEFPGNLIAAAIRKARADAFEELAARAEKNGWGASAAKFRAMKDTPPA